MKIFTQEVNFRTKETFEFFRLTAIIQDVVDKSGLKKGLLLIKHPHATGAVVIIENDNSLHQDTKMSLQRLLPLDWPWSYVMEGEINARAHQAALLLGNSVSTSILRENNVPVIPTGSTISVAANFSTSLLNLFFNASIFFSFF